MTEEKHKGKLLLVGDNPFHGISHLSQAKARARGDAIEQTDYAANLVMSAFENGANGFMFSVSETTLSILRNISAKRELSDFSLYAIIPYAYEYVRLATHLGTLGLAKKLIKEIVFSGNMSAIATGLKGFAKMDPENFMKTYLRYELSRIKSASGKGHNLKSVLLHEVITDMSLALELEWLFKSYIEFISEKEIKPGFETRNFARLVTKFKEWEIDLGDVTILAPFNKIGFQMNPSRSECERVLEEIRSSDIIAMSILAAGYIKPEEAIKYIANFKELSGIVVGVSNERQSTETFKMLKSSFLN